MRGKWTRLIPWGVTVVIFAVIFARVPVAEVLAALRQVPLLPYLALMAPYSMVYCLVDSFVLTRAVHWFHQRVFYRRLLPVRASSYILSLLNPGLGQGAVAFYVHRREGIPLWSIAGTMLFLALLEFCQLALYASLGIFGFQAVLAPAFVPLYVVLVAVLGLGLLIVHKGVEPLERFLTRLGRLLRRDPTYHTRLRLQHAGLLGTLQRARLHHYLLTLLYKAPNFLLAVVVHYLALQLFGVHVPLVRLLAFLPIVFLVASLPVTVAHLGTSQAAWLYFFAAYGPESRILAYSLAAHVTFMGLNALLGLAFLPLAVRGVDGTGVVGGDTDVGYPMPAPEAPEA